MECFICGISGKMRNVLEVISPKGIIFACDKCASEEGFPVLKKPKGIFFEDPEKKGTVYERMTRLSGVTPREPEKSGLKKQEKSLREIVNRNYEEKIKKDTLNLKPRPDLTDKFHWIIMRVRRIKGLTQKELAEKIGEPESAVKMAEHGIIPEGYELIDKLERFLKVKLIKERNFYSIPEPNKNQNNSNATGLKEKTRPSVPELKERSHQTFLQSQKTLSFDRKSFDTLTIDDLQKMKKEREKRKKEESYQTKDEGDE